MSDVSISAQTTAEQRAHEPSMEEILASIRRIIADDQVLPLSRPAPEVTREAAPQPAAPVAAAPAAAAPVAPTAAPARHAFPRAAAVAPQSVPAAPAADPTAAARAAVAGLRASLRGSDSFDRLESLPPRAEAPVVRPEPPVAQAEPMLEDFLEPPRARPEPAPRVVERVAERPVERPVERPAPRPAAERAPAPFSEEGDAKLLSPGTDASVSSSFNALATTVLLQNSGMIEDSIRELLRPALKQWLDDNLPVIVERLVRQEIERVARGRR